MLKALTSAFDPKRTRDLVLTAPLFEAEAMLLGGSGILMANRPPTSKTYHLELFGVYAGRPNQAMLAITMPYNTNPQIG
jgi:hypothetical protein